ncbi:protein EMBRYO DEFECTIVE 514 isoform X2 [Salvia miltiorrhiza]|uniref:protein EMBRYO DEFECTIVE 514 isoform X2 n=1 Tax=Salvia miltiorrhiza TaxID=226208 RepID=UPI0025AC5405|nr:protein EMBRYO DEFECTIVE 514 isoform X2 [Salvia miltiorrhiza]
MADDAAPEAPMEVELTAEVSDVKILAEDSENASDVKILAEDSENGGAKRSREEDESAEQKEKRTKTEDAKSGEEEKSAGDGEGKTEEQKDDGETMAEEKIAGDGEEKTEEQKDGGETMAEEKESDKAVVGPKTFDTSVEMYDYFFKLLHSWTPNLNLNKYEHLVLLELLKKGHLEAERKIGAGVKAFQVRFHPQFKSRCFFILREDESVDDFSFRKCVDHISPLPENMQVKHDVNKALRGKGGGRGRGRGRGRGWK